MAETRESNLPPVIGRKFEVKCKDNVTRIGFLYTKDPSSDILVLVNRTEVHQGCAATKENEEIANMSSTGGVSSSGDIKESLDEIKSLYSLRFELIMGDAYLSMKDIHGSADADTWTSIEAMLSQKYENINHIVGSTDVNKKRKQMEDILKSHHLPFKVVTDSIILFDGLAKIEPPYDLSSCFSRNPIVLDKVQKLVETCNLK